MKKEYKKINRFKIKGLGWVQLNPHLLSFGHKNLPKDVHFTISWNGEKDIDFHLTRNVFNKDDKPGSLSALLPVFFVMPKAVNTEFLQFIFF